MSRSTSSLLYVFLAVLCVLPSPQAAAQAPGFADRIAGWGSPELRAAGRRLEAARAEMAGLPAEPPDAGGGSIGWHSMLSAAWGPAAPESLRVDLGSDRKFDSVVLVASSAGDGPQSGLGYGFPVRFTVEASKDAAFSNPVLLADHSGVDFPNPGALPVFLPTPGAHGRFLRITATKLFRNGDFQFFTLSEFMVLSGKRNIAAGCAVTASGSYRNSTAWNTANVTDCQTVLGPPVTAEPSPGHGFHSAVAQTENEMKSVQIDLGRPLPLEEVRLFPARPKDFPLRRGFGFPKRFKVEAAADSAFSNAVMIADFTREDFPNPGENPVTLRAEGLTARVVRITATRLWTRYDEHDFVFALSEAQVFSGGENVALGRPVTASDFVVYDKWKTTLLNDGFTSQFKIADWPGWLQGLSRRRELKTEIASLETRRAALAGEGLRGVGLALLWILAGTGVLLIAGFLRYRRLRKEEVMRLRLRIASDLHDDIGSNLGSIMLLTRLAASQSPLSSADSANQTPAGPESSQDSGSNAKPVSDELEEIHRVARETAESMRDIVWLIQPGKHSTGDLAGRMRETARSLLPDATECRLAAETHAAPLPLDVQRQVFLIFKEAINNIRKHAQAHVVEIHLRQTAHALRLVIQDNGIGFFHDPGDAGNHEHGLRGHGLKSMRLRAEALKGTLEILSTPGTGTRLELNCRPGGIRRFW